MLKIDYLNKRLETKISSNEFEKIATAFLEETEFKISDYISNSSLRRIKKFSDDSIVLWENKNYILLLSIWEKNATNIHDHGFTGAFKVIDGDRIHSTFKCHDNLITLSDVKVLKKNSVSNIPKGSRLIHQIFYKDSPCYTTIFREKENHSQNDYFPPHYIVPVSEIKRIKEKEREGLTITQLADVFGCKALFVLPHLVTSELLQKGNLSLDEKFYNSFNKYIQLRRLGHKVNSLSSMDLIEKINSIFSPHGTKHYEQ